LKYIVTFAGEKMTSNRRKHRKRLPVIEPNIVVIHAVAKFLSGLRRYGCPLATKHTVNKRAFSRQYCEEVFLKALWSALFMYRKTGACCIGEADRN
jgi:hypothetical protein